MAVSEAKYVSLICFYIMSITILPGATWKNYFGSSDRGLCFWDLILHHWVFLIISQGDLPFTSMVTGSDLGAEVLGVILADNHGA